MSFERPRRVAVDRLWKTFWFYRRPLDRVTSWLSRGRFGRPTPFHALREVSLTLHAGESLGIIGVNGAGKSTLLKIVTGTMEPTAGTARVDGRLASLLELGTGFHPLFTGRQNIRYNARFIGLTDAEIEERLPAIEAFSELGDFLDRPLRTYSTGMQVRLAFSVAANVAPDVLVVDEVLAVGDAYFQQKCLQRIRKFRDDGVSILFVSHDPGAMKTLCERAILLHEGAIADEGEPTRVLARYNALIARKTAESHYFAIEERGRGPVASRSGSFAAIIAEVELLDGDGRPTRAVIAGSSVVVRVRVLFLEPIVDPTVGILLRDRLGNDVYGTNTFHQRVETGQWAPGDWLEVRFAFDATLGPGEYSVTAAVHSLGAHVLDSYDWSENALIFRILPADERAAIGVVQLRPTIAVAPVPPAAETGEVLARVFGEVRSHLAAADGASALLCAGWYAVERTGGDAYRWTAAEAAFVLRLAGTRLHFEVGADRPPGAAPVAVRVSTLGRILGSFRVPAGPGWHRAAVDLPADIRRDAAYLRLAVDDPWRPADAGDGDGRLLGVRVRRIWSDG
jgi:lipopolysaccharide transport system ATP-binding protein